MPQWLELENISRKNILGWSLLLSLSLILTAYLSYGVWREIEHQVEFEFEFDSDEVVRHIEARLNEHKQVLLGGAALFDASDMVERHEWQDYTARLRLDDHFKGILGFGFAELIRKDQLAAHIDKVRKEGFPHYTVWPAGDRDVYSSIVYLEPFKGRNLRAFGYDMFSEPVRHAAMVQARDQNIPALSGKVLLVQETGKDVQAGTLMYVPVYRRGAAIETVEQRRAALEGWVYSPFRMKDLLQGVLKGKDNKEGKHLHLEVFDGNPSQENLLFSSEQDEGHVLHLSTLFETARKIDFDGRIWTLHFELARGTAYGIDYSKVWVVLLSGVGFTGMLLMLMLAHLGTQRRAKQIAEKLTLTLSQQVAMEKSLNEQLSLQSSALNASANAIVIADAEGMIEWANPAFSRLTGYRLGEAIGHAPGELIGSGKQDQAFYKQMWETILSGAPWHGELINKRKNGELYHEEMTITPVVNEAGDISHFIAIKEDIGKRKRAEAIFHGLFDQSSFLAGVLDQQDRLVEVNTTALRVTRINKEEVVGQYFPDTVWWSDSEDREKLIQALAQAHQGQYAGFETTHLLDGGMEISVMFNAMPIFLDDGIWVAVVGVDITERKKIEQALRESEARFRIMADNAPVLIWMAGVDQQSYWFNKPWLDFTGRSLEQEAHSGWINGIHPEDLSYYQQTYAKAFESRRDFIMEYRLRRADGEYRWMINHGVPRYDDNGHFHGYIGSCVDITDRHEMEEQVQQLAFYDALTALPNRRLLSERLKQAMAESKRSGEYAALIFLDLDHFKPLNDEHGHAVGDLLLVEVARRLAACVREVDTVARFGGDEFVVILSQLHADKNDSLVQARFVAEKISSRLAETYVLNISKQGEADRTVEHTCTASLGVVLFHEHERHEGDILKWADVAMYQAKGEGRNNICFYSHDQEPAE